MATRSIDILFSGHNRTDAAFAQVTRNVDQFQAKAKGGILGDFGDAVAGKLAKAFVGLTLIKGGLTAISGVVKLAKGDVEGFVESLEHLPIVGRYIIAPFNELREAITNSKEEARELVKQQEEHLKIARELADIEAKIKSGEAGGGARSKRIEEIERFRKENERLADDVFEQEEARQKAAEKAFVHSLQGTPEQVKRQSMSDPAGFDQAVKNIKLLDEKRELLKREHEQRLKEIAVEAAKDEAKESEKIAKDEQEAMTKEIDDERKLAELKRQLHEEDLRKHEGMIAKEASAREEAIDRVKDKLEDFFGFQERQDKTAKALESFFGFENDAPPGLKDPGKLAAFESRFVTGKSGSPDDRTAKNTEKTVVAVKEQTKLTVDQMEEMVRAFNRQAAGNLVASIW